MRIYENVLSHEDRACGPTAHARHLPTQGTHGSIPTPTLLAQCCDSPMPDIRWDVFRLDPWGNPTNKKYSWG